MRHCLFRFRKYVSAVSIFFMASAAHAQSFDLEQFDQLFRPRVRLDAQFANGEGKEPFTGTFDQRAFSAVFTVPVHRKWSVGAEVDLGSKGLGELLKNSVRVKASQVLANVRVGTREVAFDALLGTPRRFHTVSAGALGTSLTRKFHVLFWSANVNVSEEEATFDHAVPRVNGVIGKLKVKGLRRQVFYGLAASWSDGVPLPIPFFGGVAPLGDDWSFQYVLPIQLTAVWKPMSRTRIMAGIGADGWRSGFSNTTGPVQWEGGDRINLNHASLRAFAGIRRTIDHGIQLRAEVAYAWQDLRTSMDGDVFADRTLQPGPRVLIGVNILFGDDVFQRVLDLLAQEALR